MLSIFLDVAGAYLVSVNVRARSAQLYIAIALGMASSIAGNFVDHIFLHDRTIDETLARTIAGALLWHPCISILAVWLFQKRHPTS
jgi:hypothetical protein